MAETRAELGPRKAAVLRAVVEEYVRSGEPVGSETVAERSGARRLERHDPQRAGGPRGARVPHATRTRAPAGSRPTSGYRFYVDAAPTGGRLPDTQRRAIAAHFAEAILDLEEVLKGSVQLLSRLTQYAGLAVPPGASDEQIVRVEVVDMGPTLLVLVIGQHGRVDKQIVDRPERWTRGPSATPSAGSRPSAGSPTPTRRPSCSAHRRCARGCRTTCC